MSSVALDNLRSLDVARAKAAAKRPAAPQERAADPASVEVEAAFLDGLMSSATTPDERAAALVIVEPLHMFNHANQKVLAVVKDLCADGIVPDPVIVVDRLRGEPPPNGGWKSYVYEVLPAAGCHASAPPSEHAKVLVDRWRAREAIGVFEAGASKGREGVESIVVIDEARAKLTALAASHAAASGPPAKTTSDGVQDVWTTIAAATEHGRPIGNSWGFAALDERVGRLQQPQYVVIGGRSGQGKTQIAWQTATNLADPSRLDPETGMRESAYYASYEMAGGPLLLRGICNEANVPIKMVQAGNIPRERNPYKDGAACPACGIETRGDIYHGLPTNSRGERVCRSCLSKVGSVDVAPVPVPLYSPYERLLGASQLISEMPIFIDDKPCPPLQLAERFKRVRDLAAEGKMKTRKGHAYAPSILRTLMVDSIQDTPAPPGPSNRNRTTEIQDVSRGLLNLGKECNISVIGLAKLTREVDKQKDKRPQLKDIRECGDIEYQADEIFFVHREQYYQRDQTPPEWRNIAEMIHGKGRAGLDLEAPHARLWFAGGMFFDAPPEGWPSWSERYGVVQR